MDGLDRHLPLEMNLYPVVINGVVQYPHNQYGHDCMKEGCLRTAEEVRLRGQGFSQGPFSKHWFGT